MFLIQKGARTDAHLIFFDCPRHGLRRSLGDHAGCPMQGCMHRRANWWKRWSGFDIASWKPICYGAYRARVRDELRRVLNGEIDPSDADFYPSPSHILTAYDVD